MTMSDIDRGRKREKERESEREREGERDRQTDRQIERWEKMGMGKRQSCVGGKTNRERRVKEGRWRMGR